MEILRFLGGEYLQKIKLSFQPSICFHYLTTTTNLQSPPQGRFTDFCLYHGTPCCKFCLIVLPALNLWCLPNCIGALDSVVVGIDQGGNLKFTSFAQLNPISESKFADLPSTHRSNTLRIPPRPWLLKVSSFRLRSLSSCLSSSTPSTPTKRSFSEKSSPTHLMLLTRFDMRLCQTQVNWTLAKISESTSSQTRRTRPSHSVILVLA